jgi:hypothetical protein
MFTCQGTFFTFYILHFTFYCQGRFVILNRAIAEDVEHIQSLSFYVNVIVTYITCSNNRYMQIVR